jgi:cation:H+ antiporter
MLEIFFVLLMVVISLFVLVKGADYLVDGASDFARFMRISPVIVGLTIVAFGTSLPEFIVSLFSALSGQSDISIGNIIGSNIANITLIIGVCVIIAKKIKIKSKTLIYEFPFMIFSSFLLLILANDFFIFGKDTFSLSRFDGIIFTIVFLAFMYYVFKTIKDDKKTIKKEFKEEYKHKNPLWKNISYMVGGIIALVAGGKLFATYAGQLSALAGLSQSFIGLTIAALGTSLPELAASGVAAWKGHGDIAIGNVVGSNIFNVLFVLGATTLIRPMKVSASVLSVDAVIMILVSMVFLVFATKNKAINRKEGVALLSTYVLYIAFVIWRL